MLYPKPGSWTLIGSMTTVMILTIMFWGIGMASPNPVVSQGACPTPVFGCQPNPGEIQATFNDAGLNRLHLATPEPPQLWPGYPATEEVDPFVPCILLKAIAYGEGAENWKQFDLSYGNCGYTFLHENPNNTCDMGIMQLNSNTVGVFDQPSILSNYAYNIDVGTYVLITKWNDLVYNQGISIGNNNPRVIENWYYAVWYYNSFGWTNNPNNTENFPNTDRAPWECWQDPGQFSADYPYQELVWGCAANTPGVEYWRHIPLTLVDRSLLPQHSWEVMPEHIDTPQPLHRYSCSIIYLPINRIGGPSPSRVDN